MAVRERLLTASELAVICEVDLKTIHNWVERGRIPHFRTPGRHLRFRAPDVADFLRAWGYTVPRDLARSTAKSVLVCGTKEAGDHVGRVLADVISVKHVAHPYDALVAVGYEPPDVCVLDVRGLSNEIDLNNFVAALRRALPNGSFIALSDEPVTLPSFVRRIASADAKTLRMAIVPEELATPAAPVAAAGQPAADQGPGVQSAGTNPSPDTGTPPKVAGGAR